MPPRSPGRQVARGLKSPVVASGRQVARSPGRQWSPGRQVASMHVMRARCSAWAMANLYCEQDAERMANMFPGGGGGVWVLVRDACMQNLTLPQCHWWSLSCSLLCFWGWILMPPMGRGMLQMRSHFSFTRVGAHELPTLSTGGALHGGRRQLDRYDLVSRSGAAHKQQMQLPCAKHQHVQPMC